MDANFALQRLTRCCGCTCAENLRGYAGKLQRPAGKQRGGDSREIVAETNGKAAAGSSQFKSKLRIAKNCDSARRAGGEELRFAELLA
jgi:hypothetical protein